MQADFAVVQDENFYIAALYLSGRHIPGPKLPQELAEPKGDVTHFMGNRPSVGLTSDEAARILHEVNLENSVLQHRRIMD